MVDPDTYVNFKQTMSTLKALSGLFGNQFIKNR